MIGEAAASLVRTARSPTLDERLCFLHFQKCGGTSLDRALRELFSVRDRIFGRVVRLRSQASFDAAALHGMTLGQFREQLLLYFLSDRQNRYVSGHFHFSDLAYDTFAGEWKFVTLLRHPVERWYSTYFYSRYKEGAHRKHEMDLDEYMASERAVQSATVYLRMLNGTKESATTDAAVRRSIANLEKFSVLGTLENLDAFLARFRQRFGCRLAVRHINRNPKSHHDGRADIPADVRRRVQTMCEPDLEIYEAAQRISMESS